MTSEGKIVCLAVDDEPPALDILKTYISAIAALELAGTCNNAVQALNVLQHKNIDLLFLDIQMPQLLGTDLIRTLKNPPKVIFTTAHRKFAIEGFELDAVDYLLKPISLERFLKAVNKVFPSIQPLNTTPQPAPAANPLPEVSVNPAPPPPHQLPHPRKDAFLQLRADRKMVQIPLDDILYIESLRDYIKVITRTRTVISKQSISLLDDTLPKDAFIRIHRSYIVALDKIESYTSEVVDIGKRELPISRMYRLEVEKVLQRQH